MLGDATGPSGRQSTELRIAAVEPELNFCTVQRGHYRGGK